MDNLKTIKITRNIKASPDEIYRALTNPFTIELWTGEPAVMSEEPGSPFTMLEGAINGKNIVFDPDKSIRQKWFFGEDHASEVFIELFPDKNHTRVVVLHTGIPAEAYENMLTGWKEVYLASLQDFFELA